MITVTFQWQFRIQFIVVNAFLVHKEICLVAHHKITQWLGKALVGRDIGGGIKDGFNPCQKDGFGRGLVQVRLCIRSSGRFGCMRRRN